MIRRKKQTAEVDNMWTSIAIGNLVAAESGTQEAHTAAKTGDATKAHELLQFAGVHAEVAQAAALIAAVDFAPNLDPGPLPVENHPDRTTWPIR